MHAHFFRGGFAPMSSTELGLSINILQLTVVTTYSILRIYLQPNLEPPSTIKTYSLFSFKTHKKLLHVAPEKTHTNEESLKALPEVLN